jgi:hypothetical protein
MLLKSMLCPVSNLCSATADFSGWPRRMCLICSLHLASTDCQFVQHRLCCTHKAHSIHLQLLGPVCLLQVSATGWFSSPGHGWSWCRVWQGACWFY